MTATHIVRLSSPPSRCVRARAERSRSGVQGSQKVRKDSIQAPVQLQRRALGALLLSPVLAGAEGLVQPASASSLYEDKQDGFTLSVPDNWTFAVPQQPYDRFRAGVSTTRTLAWFPESGTDINVSIVINTPGADYTSLKSFGSPTDFGLNLVASMDRSFMKGKGMPIEEVQVAKLVNASSDGPSYGIEYTIQRGLEEQKHLYSRVIMGSNGRLRRFYTITATCPESKVQDVGPVLKAAVASLTVQNVF